MGSLHLLLLLVTSILHVSYGKLENECTNELVSFTNWLDSKQNESLVKLLALNSGYYLTSIEASWKCSLYRDTSIHKHMFEISVTDTTPLDVVWTSVNSILKRRLTEERVRKPTILIINSVENLSGSMLSELMKAFYKKSTLQTIDEYQPISSVCLIFFSNLGQDLLSKLDSVDESYNRDIIAEDIYKEIRMLWPDSSQFVYNNYRRVVEVIYGDLGLSAAVKLIKAQKMKRKSSKKMNLSLTGVEFLENSDFVGQREVLAQVITSLRASSRGLIASDGPLIYLFAGIAGTGKTYLSQLISIAYNYDLILEAGLGRASVGEMIDYLSKKNMHLHVDMGNYQDSRAIDGFVDPSPGLQGEGVLSSVFAKGEKRIVVVLDEIEKAHPSLLKDMLLPVLDNNNGHIQKKKTGESFRTKDSVFVLTTNCFDGKIRQLFEKKYSYRQITALISSLFQSVDAVCLSSQNQDNPFAWKSLWRRIMAGQSPATDDGFLAFLPPRTGDLRVLAEIALENLNRRYSKNQEGIQGVFYSDKVPIYFEKSCAGVENMAEVQSVVERTVVSLILGLKTTDDRFYGILYLKANGGIGLRVVSNRGPSPTKHTSMKYPSTSRKTQTLETNDLKRVIEDAEVNDLECHLAEDLESAEKIQQVVKQNHSVEFSLQILGLVLLAVIIGYLFVFPILKMFASVVLLLSAAMYLISPELFFTLFSILSSVISMIWGLCSKGGFFAVGLGILLYYASSFYIKRKSTENAEAKLKQRSSKADIQRRWAILVLRLQQIKKFRNIEPLVEVQDSTKELVDLNRHFVYTNRRRLLRANSNPIHGRRRRTSQLKRAKRLLNFTRSFGHSKLARG